MPTYPRRGSWRYRVPPGQAGTGKPGQSWPRSSTETHRKPSGPVTLRQGQARGMPRRRAAERCRIGMPIGAIGMCEFLRADYPFGWGWHSGWRASVRTSVTARHGTTTR